MFINYKSKVSPSQQRKMFKARVINGHKQDIELGKDNYVLSWSNVMSKTKPDKLIVKQVKEKVHNPMHPVKIVAKKHFLVQKYIKTANEKVIHADMYPKWISRVDD